MTIVFHHHYVAECSPKSRTRKWRRWWRKSPRKSERSIHVRRMHRTAQKWKLNPKRWWPLPLPPPPLPTFVNGLKRTKRPWKQSFKGCKMEFIQLCKRRFRNTSLKSKFSPKTVERHHRRSVVSQIRTSLENSRLRHGRPAKNHIIDSFVQQNFQRAILSLFLSASASCPLCFIVHFPRTRRPD